jgi:hypothetical protein
MMAMDEISRHRLWCKADEVLGEECAALLMEYFRPAYEAIVARQAAGEQTPDVMSGLSAAQDRERHELWRRLEQVLGPEPAWTLIQLWDEAGRQKRPGHVRAA